MRSLPMLPAARRVDPPARAARGGAAAVAACACALAGVVALGPSGAAHAADAAVALPAPRLAGPVALEATLLQRRSLRAFADDALTSAEVGQLLWAAQGLSDAEGRRTAPSAGARYPLELYLAAGRVQGLAPGLYRYRPQGHALEPLGAADPRAAITAACAQPWVGDAPVLVLVAASTARTAARYGARAERYVALEAGAAAQNLLLQAVALGLGGTPVGAFDDAALRRALTLAADEQPLLVLPVGRPPR